MPVSTAPQPKFEFHMDLESLKMLQDLLDDLQNNEYTFAEWLSATLATIERIRHLFRDPVVRQMLICACDTERIREAEIRTIIRAFANHELPLNIN
jgi:hypothetical protein